MPPLYFQLVDLASRSTRARLKRQNQINSSKSQPIQRYPRQRSPPLARTTVYRPVVTNVTLLANRFCFCLTFNRPSVPLSRFIVSTRPISVVTRIPLASVHLVLNFRTRTLCKKDQDHRKRLSLSRRCIRATINTQSVDTSVEQTQ